MPWIGGAIAGGASILGGLMGSDAANSAADTQAASAGQSIAEQRRQFDLTRADNSQFTRTGTAANQRLAQLLGLPSSTQQGSGPLTPDQVSKIYQTYMGRSVAPDEMASLLANNQNAASLEQSVASSPEHLYHVNEQKNVTEPTQPLFTNQASTDSSPDFGSLTKKFSTADLNADPVYQSGLQFGLDQGAGAINARATQAGSYDSGATLKALTRFGNDYGSTKANESFNRYNATNDSIYNKLAGTSGAGQQATAQVNTAGANMANNVSNDLTGAGNARAAGIVGGANAWGNAVGGATSAYNNYQSNQILQQLLKKNGTNAGSSFGGSGSYSSFSPDQILAG